MVVVSYFCTKISPRCKLNVFLCLFWAFPWICTVTLNFSPYMQLLLNDLIFNAWLTKGEKWKMKGEKEGTGPLNLPEVTSAGGRGACNNLATDNQNRSQYLEDRVLFTHPGFCKLCTSCSRNTRTAACHVAGDGRWVAATVLRAQNDWNKLQFTIGDFPWQF